MAKMTDRPTTVRVTRKDMARGKASDCFRCAVAAAMQRATGDDHANVYCTLDGTHLEVHGRHIRAPWEVIAFTMAYDELPCRLDATVILPRKLPDELKPFAFELPPFSDPEWQEQCYGCESLFDPQELDDEGNCESCRRENV